MQEKFPSIRNFNFLFYSDKSFLFSTDVISKCKIVCMKKLKGKKMPFVKIQQTFNTFISIHINKYQ